MFSERKEKYPQADIVLDDGSKIDDKVSSAVVTSDITDYHRLSDLASVYSAEQFSILKALKAMPKRTAKQYLFSVLIFSKQFNP